jgi:hypothetical protein
MLSEHPPKAQAEVRRRHNLKMRFAAARIMTKTELIGLSVEQELRRSRDFTCLIFPVVSIIRACSSTKAWPHAKKVGSYWKLAPRCRNKPADGMVRALTARLVSSAMEGEGDGARWRILAASSSHTGDRRGCGEWREGGAAAALFGIGEDGARQHDGTGWVRLLPALSRPTPFAFR